MLSLLWILAAFALVLLNAFFVAAEFGMVKLRHTKLEEMEEDYGLRGRILSRVHKNLDAYLSACQLGITLASLGLGWIGEPAFSQLLQSTFVFFGVISPVAIKFVSVVVAFALISFLHIVVGELVPKSLAIRQSENVSIWTAIPLYAFYWLMFPAIWVLNACSNFILKIMNLDRVHKGESFHSTDEIKLILSSSHSHGELTKDETEILEHTLDFADLEVTDMMRPFDEMVVLDVNLSSDAILQAVLETQYSRYPVVDGSPQNIIGIIHVKDLLEAYYKDKDKMNLRHHIRPILQISWRLSALDLLRKFRAGMPHFAVIYRGSESPIGFITLDNLLHILVGRIKDEFHKTKDDWVPTDDGGFILQGNCSLYTVERVLDTDIEADVDVTTLYGYIFDKLGRLPLVGEKIEFEEFTAIIMAMQGAKIVEVKIFAKHN